MWLRYLIIGIALLSTDAFIRVNGRIKPLLRPTASAHQLFERGGVAFEETTVVQSTQGQRLDPNDVANLARKDLTHILILPGFATSTDDYTEEGSLAPNLAGRDGWKKEQIHVIPVERMDWLTVWKYGLMDSDLFASLVGLPGSGAPPDRLPYRWYLKRVAQTIREIDGQVKAECGPDAKAKVIVIGHSAGGWLGRAALGLGFEHKQNATILEPELGIDIDNILAFVSLGTPHVSPSEGSPDVTGGAIKITNNLFPGSFFEDKMFYVTAAGRGQNGALARQSYELVSGVGTAKGDCRDGDGIVPIESAHLDGATQINIENISHGKQLVAKSGRSAWYGSDVIVDEWFGEVLNQLTYIQGGKQVFQQPLQDEGVIAGAVEAEDKKEVVEFVKGNEGFVEDYFCRRNALRHSGIFSRIPDKKSFESLVYSMEGYILPIDELLISQGAESDSMFFVKSGKFECYDEATGEVKAIVGKNRVIGELGFLLGQPRALSVRVATPNACVYKLSSQDIKKYTSDEECSDAASSLGDEVYYADYFDEKSKRDALKSCPLFKELEEYDVKRVVASMRRMEIPAGVRIIEEGTRGESMYFVENGRFACYRESNKQVVKVCQRHDYFGELGVIFEKPRAVSVYATDPSIVWELKGDAFMECYRKMTAAKFGASVWVLALAEVVGAEKWISRLIPKPLSHFLNKLRYGAGNFLNQYFLSGHYFRNSPRRGTNTHLINAILSVAIPLYFRTSASSGLSKLVMNLGFAGLVFDNLVNASGRYFGEGNILRRLCKMRTICHALTIPFLFLPVIEIATKSGLFPAQASKVAMAAVVAFALHEVIDWISFDIKDMVLVDNRDAKKHSPRALAGTLWYSSGKVLKNVLPAAVLQLFMLVMGSILWRRGVAGGPWLVASGVLTLISCSLQRPDIQAFGEPAMMGLLYAASAAFR